MCPWWLVRKEERPGCGVWTELKWGVQVTSQSLDAKGTGDLPVHYAGQMTL